MTIVVHDSESHRAPCKSMSVCRAEPKVHRARTGCQLGINSNASRRRPVNREQTHRVLFPLYDQKSRGEVSLLGPRTLSVFLLCHLLQVDLDFCPHGLQAGRWNAKHFIYLHGQGMKKGGRGRASHIRPL